VSRTAHQKEFSACDFEPLRPVRWAEALEKELRKKA